MVMKGIAVLIGSVRAVRTPGPVITVAAGSGGRYRGVWPRLRARPGWLARGRVFSLGAALMDAR